MIEELKNMSVFDPIIVKGTSQRANVFEPNIQSKKYQIDICQLGKADVKKLEEEGIEVKTGTGDNKNKGRFVVAKTKILPRVTDSAKNLWPSTIKIGNGSKVKCSVNGYKWDNEYGTGIGLSLNSVMIIEYKEADMNSRGDLDAEEGGFVLGDLEGEEIPFEVGDDL